MLPNVTVTQSEGLSPRQTIALPYVADPHCGTSVKEILRHGERPKLPPVDPRSLVGDTQDKMLMV
jgi:hypothetical protein